VSLFGANSEKGERKFPFVEQVWTSSIVNDKSYRGVWWVLY
jgi:hypothetical protein